MLVTLTCHCNAPHAPEFGYSCARHPDSLLERDAAQTGRQGARVKVLKAACRWVETLVGG